jgi:hypothetical protein
MFVAKALLGIVVAIGVLVGGLWLYEHHKRADEAAAVESTRLAHVHDDPSANARKPNDAPCSGEQARLRWLATDTTKDGYTTSPEKEGLSAGGVCNLTLKGRNLGGCEEAAVRTVYGDTPFVAEAIKLGFTTFSCGEVRSGEVVRWVDYPLERILVAK